MSLNFNLIILIASFSQNLNFKIQILAGNKLKISVCASFEISSTLRTIPGHICFNNKRATGVPRMRRILRGLAWLYPDIGYCQVCIIIVVMDQIPQISGFQVPQSSIEFRLIEKKIAQPVV